MEAAAQSSIFGNDFATASLFLWLKVFPIPPQICLFQIQIFIVGFFQDLFFVGKFQKVVGFVKFVVAGIDEVFFALRLAVVAVRHHQIPVHGLFDGILRGVEGVLALPMYLMMEAATPVSSWTSRRAVCLKSSPGSTVPLEEPILRICSGSFCKERVIFPEI